MNGLSMSIHSLLHDASVGIGPSRRCQIQAGVSSGVGVSWSSGDAGWSIYLSVVTWVLLRSFIPIPGFEEKPDCSKMTHLTVVNGHPASWVHLLPVHVPVFHFGCLDSRPSFSGTERAFHRTDFRPISVTMTNSAIMTSHKSEIERHS